MKQPPFEHLVSRQERLDLPYDKPLAFIRVTEHDGNVYREGPFSHWVAQQIIGSGAFIGTTAYMVVIEPVADFAHFVGDS